MSKQAKILVVFFVSLALCVAAHADELLVPAEYPTIQAAIDAAYDGDAVIVADGTYTGPGNRDIDFKGKAITVRSESGPENCIIDCNGTEKEWHRGFYFDSGEGANSVLLGFTIRNGYSYGGGGIFCWPGSPQIIRCNIERNTAVYGGGIEILECSPKILRCNIRDNTAEDVGGGISCFKSSMVITNCNISNNSTEEGGAILCYDSSPKITNCTLTGNSADQAGAIFSRHRSNVTITNCTFADNSAFNGSALACDSWKQKYSSNIQVTNCILWDSGNEIWNNDNSTITITYSDIQDDWEGEGNIDADPLFVEPVYWDVNGLWVDGDYHLLPDSPCIDAGDPNYIAEPNETDLDANPRVSGNAIDMGAYEYKYVRAAMIFIPKTVNCNSEGNWLKAHFVLPEGFLPEDVDVNAPAVAEPIGAESEYIRVFGNDDGPVKLEVAFDRQAFCDLLTDGDSLEITVIGSLTTGQYFHGSDTIRIIPRRE